MGLNTLSSSWLRFITVKGYKARSAKGKAPWGQVQGTRHRLPKVLSWLSHTVTSCGNTGEALSTRKLSGDSAPGSFSGGWSHGHPRPSTYPNSRLLEGKQVFSINHRVCTNNLGVIRASLISPTNVRK